MSSEPDADAAPASAPSSGLARGAAWVTLGLAGASLAFAIVENMSYLNKRGDFDDGVAAGPCGTGLPGRGAAGCAALYEDMNGAKTASIIGFAATGVLSAGSALLFILGPPATPERRIACAPQGTGVGCRLSF